MAASITTYAPEGSALVGSNKPHAAMMQFGGKHYGATFRLDLTCPWRLQAHCNPKQSKP
ncbi:hypothetical protein ACYZTM_04020 [Pseudomonas sp. MDT2-39-1]